MHKITIKNLSDKPKKLSVYPYLRPSVNLNGHLAYGKGYFDADMGGLYYTFHAFNESNPYQETFYKCSEKAVAYATNDRQFIGVYGRLDKPVALRQDKLNSENAAFSDDYWRGPTWLNVAYFAAKGLKNYGFSVADTIQKSILDMCAQDKDGIYENYNSITGKGQYCNRFGWSCVFIFEFLLDF
jgi:hypothetical protein